jgi:3-phenylpropionate/cinnamic acid dioxygenase small subunit
MSHSATEIANLLYRYAELMDAGKLEATAELFRHARIKSGAGGELLDSAGMLERWRQMVKIHPCGTPRTKHVVTNPIIEVDETAGTASCRSYYTVLQATAVLPLQVIAAGRYHDEFERADGKWRFSYRDYTLFDLQGDLSDHLKVVIPQ